MSVCVCVSLCVSVCVGVCQCVCDYGMTVKVLCVSVRDCIYVSVCMGV